MRVAVMGFGSVWRHRPGRQVGHGRYTQPVYYNTTGITVNGRIRQRPRISGYARFDMIGGFDPNRLSKMTGRSFECAEPSVCLGCNKLLFKRILNPGECPDRFLVTACSALTGQLAVGQQGWRSDGTWILSLSESAGQQESLLLMSIGEWVHTNVGLFVLESCGTVPALARLVLQAGA